MNLFTKECRYCRDIKRCNQCFHCIPTVYPEFWWCNYYCRHDVNSSSIYVIIAFSVDTNVIAGPASVPTKIGRSLLIVLSNTCSQDPPCFISCIISFRDVKLYRSPILNLGENDYFLYANTTNGLHVTIFKHINVQDPGTVIITKKLGDGNHGFAVRGKYWTPKISDCDSDCSSRSLTHGWVWRVQSQFIISVHNIRTLRYRSTRTSVFHLRKLLRVHRKIITSQISSLILLWGGFMNFGR